MQILSQNNYKFNKKIKPIKNYINDKSIFYDGENFKHRK